MNINKITQKVIKDSLTDEFIVAMMILYLTDEQKGTIMDEIVNEKEHIYFKKGDIVWFDPKDNKYDLTDVYEDDLMKDALKMCDEGYIKGTIINDASYRDSCSPYSTEYKLTVDFHAVENSKTKPSKELRVKRSNIIKLWKGLE